MLSVDAELVFYLLVGYALLSFTMFLMRTEAVLTLRAKLRKKRR